MRPPRLAGVDLVRLLALLAIVAGHTLPHTELLDKTVQSWRLPLFFVITGYFWSSRRDVRGEVGKRRDQLLVPYVCWFVLIAVVTLGDGLPQALAGGDRAVQQYATFWFLTALFVAAVVFRLLERVPLWARVAVVSIGLLANVVAGPEIARIPFSVGTAFGALAFLSAGRLVRLAEDRWDPRSRVAVALGTILAVAVVLALVPFESLDMKSGRFPPGAVVVALVAGSAVLAIAAAARSIPPRVARTASALAEPSMVVIVLNPLVLQVLERHADPGAPLRIAIAFALPLAVGLALLRTPLSGALVGVPRRREADAEERRGAVAAPNAPWAPDDAPGPQRGPADARHRPARAPVARPAGD